MSIKKSTYDFINEGAKVPESKSKKEKTTFLIHISKSLIDKVVRISEINDKSSSQWIREAIQEKLKREDK